MMLSHCILPGCASYYGKNCLGGNRMFMLSVDPYSRIHREWKRDLFEFCCRYRERSAVFGLARKGNAGICGRHFKKSDFIIMKYMTKIIPGRMPSLNLPARRSARIRLKRKPTPRARTGVECSAYGCNKRRKAYSKEENIRSDSEGSEDEETKEKRKQPRTFHPFPSDPVLLKKWLVNVRRKSWIPTSKSIICSDHFKEEDIVRSAGYTAGRLRDGALPTRFKAFKKNLKDDYDEEAEHHEEPLCDHSIFGVTNLEQHSSEDGEAFSVPCSLVRTTLPSIEDGGKLQQDVKMGKLVDVSQSGALVTLSKKSF